MSKPDIARSLRERHGITKARNEDDKKLCVLTYNQQSLWFMQEVDPTRVDYVVHWCAAVKETLDVEALRCAFQSLSDIHPSLRTTYDDENGMPYQIVHKNAEVDFQIVGEAWNAAAIEEQLDADLHSPWDLRKEFPFRARLYPCDEKSFSGERRYVLMILAHHIAMDGWSLDIVPEGPWQTLW